MTDNGKHTPTPWHFDLSTVYGPVSKTVYVNGEYFKEIICSAINRDDAAFIVRAVNSHEEVLNVLTWLSNEIDANGQGILPDALVGALNRAIARAEGEII